MSFKIQSITDLLDVELLKESFYEYVANIYDLLTVFLLCTSDFYCIENESFV